MEEELVRIVQCENKLCEKDFVYKKSEATERQPWEFLVCPHCGKNNGIPIENKERFEEWQKAKMETESLPDIQSQIGDIYENLYFD